MIFNLPDLGEGLPDAEIHEWFVKEGDEIKVDDPLVSMETAKAVVEVPSPQHGVIEKLFGKVGDIIKTGTPLVQFAAATPELRDAGTVVGNLEESDSVSEDNFITSDASGKRSRATPAVRMLARKLGVDLVNLTGSGDHGVITEDDVRRAIASSKSTEAPATASPDVMSGYEPLHGSRRTMIHSMTESHREVVAVSIFDEADINHWHDDTDITVRLIRAIQSAALQEPALNAWYDPKAQARKLFDKVHPGIAMDNAAGLFVPVIQDSNDLSDEELRNIINTYKTEVNNRTLAPENFRGATITLSNFGKFAGKFASPIIVPPQVAILAVGRIYEGAACVNYNVVAHKLLPLSLSFDHRSVTGGEATRFLGHVITALEN